MMISIAHNKFVQKDLVLAVELNTFLKLSPCKNWLWYKNYNASFYSKKYHRLSVLNMQTLVHTQSLS